jgi:hypothetical protein
VLLSETLTAAAQEKNATLRLLEFLAEIDERRLYNARGYASLWEYVHLALGYSEASASERVSAMRLMRRVPEVRVELAENRLTLTGAAKLASFVRRERCSVEKAAELLVEIRGQSTRGAERVLAQHQSAPVVKPDVIRASGPEVSRVAFDADPEFLALYEELRNLQGRPEWTMKERLKNAMREAIAQRKSMTRRKPARPSAMSIPEEKPVRAPEVPASPPRLNPHSRYIPLPVRRATLARSGGRCEFVDRATGRRCANRFGLHFDHRIPFAKGGPATAVNIRQLCPSHNRYAAIREFGAAKVIARMKKACSESATEPD